MFLNFQSQREGTRINSSAKSSIFSWDDHKYVRHFKITPEPGQCYHSARRVCNNLQLPPSGAMFCPYEVGEEVLYKKCGSYGIRSYRNYQ